MALFGFGKRPKHKSFEYTPRYYDPDKEDLKNRLSKYDESTKNDPEAIKARIKGGFSKPITRSYESDAYKKALKRSNKVVLIVTLILLTLTLFFLLEYLPNFIDAFEK